MAIHRVTVQWNGFVGAPGYSNFFFAGAATSVEADASVLRVAQFFTQLSSVLPSDIVLDFPDEVENVDEATGALTGYAARSASAMFTPPAGVGGYSAPSGGVISWLTDTVNRGRRVRGRTFIVPLDGDSYDDTGSLTPAATTALRNAADALIGEPGGSELVIWSRPRLGAGGVAAPVTSASVPDLAAVLRSRRD